MQRDELIPVGNNVYELPATARPGMRVPARVYADETLLSAILDGEALNQLANVATYPAVGQPVFIPGSMGTASWVMVGDAMSERRSWSSACHGGGRALSRHAAKAQITGSALRHELESRGIVVRCPSNRGLAEEAPFAYKDIDRVAKVVEAAGLARRVARLRPLGVIKG